MNRGGRGGVCRPVLLCGLLAFTASLPVSASDRVPGTIRIATYNASLNRSAPGRLVADLAEPGNPQAQRIAAVIQRVRPDVLLVNEFDHDPQRHAARSFLDRYLGVAQAGGEPLHYPFVFSAEVNTGQPSGLDLDRDGSSAGPGDALGFGAFPGQYGMVVYSRLPIDDVNARTFRKLRWAAMPGAALPQAWYSADALAILPLSSKSHWDLPLRLPGGRTLHLLASHPTPPSFDGPEDRNGRRNHDEIRLWADYLTPDRSAYIVDDTGRRGGLAPGAAFVIVGDLNADPVDGDSFDRAILQLLSHPRVDARYAPTSAGAATAAARQGGRNDRHRGDPHEDTADFSDAGRSSAGNLRTDYVLPSRNLVTCGAGVFWPAPGDPDFALVNDDTSATSDHRLAWIDLAVDGRCPPARGAQAADPAP